MLLIMAAVFALIIGSCTALSVEFKGCKGLEGMVSKVWTGEPCAESGGGHTQ